MTDSSVLNLSIHLSYSRVHGPLDWSMFTHLKGNAVSESKMTNNRQDPNNGNSEKQQNIDKPN